MSMHDRYMPPREQWDSNPVYQSSFFDSYVDFFVSNQDLIGYPLELVDPSTMTEEEYNDHVAIPSAFDVPSTPEYYTDEEMVYVSDAEDDDDFETEEIDSSGSDASSTVTMTIVNEDDEVIREFMEAYDMMISEMGGVNGSGTMDDPYDLT